VDVGTADSHGVHTHLYFARSGLFDGLLRESEFALRGQFGN
jgi:hypothetical protein